MSDIEIRRYEVVDTDILRHDNPCPARRCDLPKGHDTPHAEIHPYSGRVLDVWEAPVWTVSDAALKVAHQINRAREEIADAIQSAWLTKATLHSKYRTLTREEDPALYAILRDRDLWPDENDPDNSGFSSDEDDSLREEIVELYNLDGSD